ncbi:MAG: 6-hydroxymethylpterin diphosphokinase MptE-like protein [Spirochaetia bacterium]|nr:6-hydroxymethylpterin diphosphokinase MptE-like protein [Spirochaetia bacterium]
MSFSPETLHIARTGKGYLSLFDGDRSLLSRYNPEAEAGKRYRAAVLEPGRPLLILGDPLGYDTLAASRSGHRHLLTVYPETRFRTASVFDSKTAPEIPTATAFDDDNAFRIIEQFLATATPSVWEIPVLEPYYRTRFSAFRNFILKRLREKAVNESVRLAFSRSWLSNAHRNFLTSAETGFFRWNPQTPVLIAAPGPSLELLIPTIRRYRDRFLLTAVTSAGRILEENGISPDFYIATDPGFYAKRLTLFLKPPQCGWLLPPTAAATVTKNDRIHLFRQQLPQETVGGGHFPDKAAPVLPETPTVTATTALFFKPFAVTAFAGLDLNAPAGKPYARGHETFLNAFFRSSRFKPSESFFPASVNRHHGHLFRQWFAENGADAGLRVTRICAPKPDPTVFNEVGLSWFDSLPPRIEKPLFEPAPQTAAAAREAASAFPTAALAALNGITEAGQIKTLPETVLSAAAAEAVRAQNGTDALNAFTGKAVRRLRRWATRVR